MRVTKAAAGMLVVVFCLLASNLQAQVVIGNSVNNVTGGSTVSDTGWKAMLFTTGSSSTQISSIILGLNPVSGSFPIAPNVNVSLYSVSAGAPNTLLTTTGLVSVSMAAASGRYTFSTFAGFTLSAATSYALVLSSDATGIKWGRDSANPIVVSNGFQYNTFVISTSSGSSWTSSGVGSFDNAFSISAAAVPEPSSYALLAGVATLGLAAVRRRRRVAVGA